MALSRPAKVPKPKVQCLGLPHTIGGDLLAPGNVLVHRACLWRVVSCRVCLCDFLVLIGVAFNPLALLCAAVVVP